MSTVKPSRPASLSGLDPTEAARRLAMQGPNLLPGSAPKTLWKMVIGVLLEPMFLMLLVAGGLYLALGDLAEASFLLSFVFVVIGITLAQERKTQRALESLRELSAPRALVVRGGEELRIPGRDVVLGDLLVLHEGDRIAADAVLLEGHLDVNESLLTGEAVPVTKLPGDNRDLLFASTVVTKDIGIAMGERGTDVAREAAAVVLLDDSFASIVAAIRQGRRIYDNITKATGFVFAVHMPIIALALVPTLLHWPVLLMPVHIVLLELLIDPACSIVFEAEPEADGIMNRPPRARTSSPFARTNLEHGVIQGLGFAAILLCGYGWMLGRGMSAVQARTGVFIALVIGLFLLILANRNLSRSLLARMGNPWLPRMFGGVLAMLVVVIGVSFFRGVMALALPDATALAWAAAMLLVTVGWLEGWRHVARRIGTWRTASG